MWSDTDFTKFRHGLLGGLGLQFTRSLDEGHVGHVKEDRIPHTGVQRELPDRFQEGQAFDVSGGSTNLGDHDIRVRFLANLFDTVLNLVGYMGDDLHRAAQVLAFTLVV